MKKTMAVILLIMGSVALGVAQAQQQPATLTYVLHTSNSVTLRVNAGTHLHNGQVVGLPYGFLINWSGPGLGSHNVSYGGFNCPEFSLPPNGEVTVTIDGVTGSECVINESPQVISCGSIKFIGEPVGIPGNIKGFALPLCP